MSGNGSESTGKYCRLSNPSLLAPRSNLKPLRTAKSSLPSALAKVRYAPIATKFRSAPK
jgi:hypothetical protein